jgi:uncharacterized protein YceK
MRTRRLIPLALLLLVGCASPRSREASAEARGYERGYAQAVKEQYWIIQNLQRRPMPAADHSPSP